MEITLHLSSDILDIYSAITFMNVLLKRKEKVRTPILILFFSIYMGILWGMESVPSVFLTELTSAVVLFLLTFIQRKPSSSNPHRSSHDSIQQFW